MLGRKHTEEELKKIRKYSMETYRAIAFSDLTLRRTAEKYGVSLSTVRYWRLKLNPSWERYSVYEKTGKPRKIPTRTPKPEPTAASRNADLDAFELAETRPEQDLLIGSRNEIFLRLNPDDIQRCALTRHVTKFSWIYNKFFDIAVSHHQRNGELPGYESLAQRLEWMTRDADWRGCFEGLDQKTAFLALKHCLGDLQEGRVTTHKTSFDCVFSEGFRMGRCWIDIPEAGKILLYQPFPTNELAEYMAQENLTIRTAHIYKDGRDWFAVQFLTNRELQESQAPNMKYEVQT